MSTLVIPDIHCSVRRAQKILDHAEAGTTKTIFLGDYFHQWNDTPEMNRLTAEWLKQKLQDERNVFLAGNHDAAHLWPLVQIFKHCPGYSEEKHAAIRSVLTQDDCNQFKLAHYADGWLLSHAGINPYYFNNLDILKEAGRCLGIGQHHELFRMGSRMIPGTSIPGGILWQDWDEEFKLVKGINQLVGHTIGRGVRTKNNPDLFSSNICLDTNLMHYAIIGEQDGDVRAKVYIYEAHGELRTTI